MYHVDPLQSTDEVDGVARVFTQRSDLISTMKKFPGSRFKIFANKQEAADYSRSPITITQTPVKRVMIILFVIAILLKVVFLSLY